jgi:hypothetical protein
MGILKKKKNIHKRQYPLFIILLPPFSYKNKATLASYLEPLKGSNVLSGYIKKKKACEKKMSCYFKTIINLYSR